MAWWFFAWLPPEIVPSFCVPNEKKNPGATFANSANSSTAETGGKRDVARSSRTLERRQARFASAGLLASTGQRL